jgi:serine/threonine protein kinase
MQRNASHLVYSLGMIMYEVLALQPPYYGMAPFEMSNCIISGERPVFPMALFQLDQYHPLICLFQECTHSDPAMRPTAQDIVSLLEIMSHKQPSSDVSIHLRKRVFGNV